ncbi:DUF998 domain-containing protein [Thermostaphylospora chromogena]|uniref:DUF998 domain-containing protein n=1 Tax=Thermostaphylospora chromogena TaxID=35622 RepID=A0A1H1FB55_9ACTN|nr:DUF998 domain-containing protein [Thermostaphylospora chromogena]SDQ98181.1 Protein of unknown function [Thermostaphylospora chromogena]
MSALTSPAHREEPRLLGYPLWAWLGGAGPVVALAALVYAHLAAPEVSLLTDPISDYAHAPDTRAASLIGTLVLAMSLLWTVYGLAGVAPAHTAATRVLLIICALGLVVTAIFTSDPAPGVTSSQGEIHRWSAAVVFTGIPVAGWMLARAPLAAALRRVLRGACLAAFLLLAVFLAVHPGSLVSELLTGHAYYALVQRVLVTVLVALASLLTAGCLALRRGGMS